MSDEAYYSMSSDGFVPADFACGPWSMDMAHGRLLGGLAARAIEAELGEAGWRGARLTMDLFRAASMEAVRVSTEVIRSGGRIRVADATVVVGGHEVARARAVFLKAGDEPPGTIWQPERASWPDPETLDPPPRSDGGEPDTRWRIRDAGGAFQGAERAKLWTEETVPLVAGEALSPFVRAAVSSDLASPLANSGDDGVHYINGDYTMVLARYPVGTWIGMHAAQHLAADGIALGECTMYDFDGAFGTSVATALSRPPLRPPLSPPVSSALSE